LIIRWQVFTLTSSGRGVMRDARSNRAFNVFQALCVGSSFILMSLLEYVINIHQKPFKGFG
jgi:hypothetical protein